MAVVFKTFFHLLKLRIGLELLFKPIVALPGRGLVFLPDYFFHVAHVLEIDFKRFSLG